jgi:sugar phosphate isomerase/epimerase
MSLSRLPLSYCTNVHPGQSIAEVDAGLDRFTVPIQTAFGQPLAAGLWLARSVVDELIATDGPVDAFAGRLAARGLTCHTLNAFPFGNFHSPRVKENVYLPDWSDPARRRYTLDCAGVLASLLPPGGEGSISTMPIAFKAIDRPPGFLDRAINALIETAIALARLRDTSGRLIRLAIEPEPFCLLETTSEAIAFFGHLREQAERKGPSTLDEVQTHLGLCYDICHQAVEFEDVGESISRIDRAGIRISKVHISSALELISPRDNSAGRAALLRYVEERYLHQTLARSSSGDLLKLVDLTREFINAPGDDWLATPSWRVHFHVPVDVATLGPLQTTRSAIVEALRAVAKLDYAPHLEVETYTWEVLPTADKPDLVSGLSRELIAASKLIAAK